MRRWVWVGLALALGGAARAWSDDLPAEWTQAKNWLVPVAEGNSAVIRDFKGNDLLKFDWTTLPYPYIGDKSSWVNEYGCYRPQVKSVRLLDPDIVRIDFAIGDPGIKEHYALLVSEGGPRLRMEQRIVLNEGAPQFGTGSGGAIWQSRIRFHLMGVCKPGAALYRDGVWVKPENGESFERGGVNLVPFTVPEGQLYLAYDTIGRFQGFPREQFWLSYRASNVAEALRDAKLTAENAKGIIMPATGEYFEQMHGKGAKKEAAAAPEVVVKGERAYSNVIDMYLLPGTNSAYVACALETGAAMAAKITTGVDFNLFNSDKETPHFTVSMVNPKNATNEVSCRVVARNFDGKEDVRAAFKVVLPPYGTTNCTFNLPGRKREYWFVNAEFDDGRTNSFVRTDVATMEPYKYKSLETSVMGIAANFKMPSAEACDRLLTRMGVRWVRSSGGFDTEKYAEKNRLGILSFHLDNKATNETLRLAFATKKLEEAAARDCPIVEIGNELNFGSHSWEESMDRATWYNGWLKAFYDARAELKLEKKVKISSFGFAGFVDGGQFFNAMDKAGCWEYCDILAIHPGRLNQTPDNGDAVWKWNYRPQIWAAKQCMEKIRAKRPLQLIMTEVYARTPPNKDDSDSTRTATESIVLSCAIAKMEGVTALNWYQLHDGLHCDINGINEHNSEYHYGLLRRDGTVKPSILAYCAVSEALDGAEFARTVEYTDERKAWYFDTPHGEMAILFDRKDGYYPYDGMFTGRPFTGHLEPWLDHWKSHTPYAFTAPKGYVIVRDAIGRTRKIKADKKGHVTLTLSGAPVFVYGLGVPVPDEKAAKDVEPWGLVTTSGATDAELATFKESGGSFLFDEKKEGFAEYLYLAGADALGLLDAGTNAVEALQKLYACGVRRVVLALDVHPKGADDAVRKMDGEEKGRAWAKRLAPFAAARKAHPDTTPGIWVDPRGDWAAVLFNGVREQVDGIVLYWENFTFANPKDLFLRLRGTANRAQLPVMVLNFAPVGFNAGQNASQGVDLTTAQFFGSLFLLSSHPAFNGVAFTNLRDCGKTDAGTLGTTPLAAAITDRVDWYCTCSGFFSNDGREKGRLKAMKFLRELMPDTSGFEYSVAQSGLRTIRFWKGGVPCAIVWQGDRNRLYGNRIDDLSGRPEAKESAIEVDLEKGGRVCDIYGCEKKVQVRKNRVELMVGDVPIVVCGVRGIVERFDKVPSQGKECASPAPGK